MNWWCYATITNEQFTVSYSIRFRCEHFCVIDLFFMYSNFHSPSFFSILNHKKRFYDLLVFGAPKILDHFFSFWFVPLEASKVLWIIITYHWTSSCKNAFPWRISSYLFSRILFIHSLIRSVDKMVYKAF